MTNSWKKLVLWLANHIADDVLWDAKYTSEYQNELEFLIKECENDILHPTLEDVEQ